MQTTFFTGTMNSIPPAKTDPVSSIRLTVCLLLALVVIHGLNILTGLAFCDWGIVPRSMIGLRGIFFAPLIHGSVGHLVSNLTPLALLLGALALDKKRPFLATLAAIWLVCGAGTWLIGRPGTVCFGASGVVYGLATFFLTSAIVDRSWWAALVVLITLPMYTGLLWGLLPVFPGISWECHLCGAIAGFVVGKTACK